MPSSATWVSRLPEFGGEEEEHDNASHMDDGGIGPVLTVDAGDPGSDWQPSGLSSSGVSSTPDVGSRHGPTEGIEQTPGAASSPSHRSSRRN